MLRENKTEENLYAKQHRSILSFTPVCTSWFSYNNIVCCQTGNNETSHCVMISVKAFCAVPFNCAAVLQYKWHTFPLQITTTQCHIIINYNFPAHSVVHMRPILQGLTWFNTHIVSGCLCPHHRSLHSVLLEHDKGERRDSVWKDGHWPRGCSNRVLWNQ